MSERKVMIAVDGSKPADLAFDWYMENMKRSGDLVILMHAAEYNVSIMLPGKAADVDAITKSMKSENDRIEGMLSIYMEKLRKAEVRAQEVKDVGSKPGESIIKAAEREGVSTIIMGSRGLGKIRRTLMGSVSDYVAQHAPAHCAVMIIRD